MNVATSLVRFPAAILFTLLLGASFCNQARAHGSIETEALPSLKGVKAPVVPGIKKFIRDNKAAIALGKALFWDQNVGSDGVACGSCHFHAGADRRIKNQINPGGKRADPSVYPSLPTGFKLMPSGGTGGPNYTLRTTDFPLTKVVEDDPNKAKLYETDNVISSAGTFGGQFTAVDSTGGVALESGAIMDGCDRSAGGLFHVGSEDQAVMTRQVEPRNTPTMINAVFNLRLFWDGRANSVFNGVDSFGQRNPGATVWAYNAKAGNLSGERVALQNSTLASLSVGPPVNDLEMSCTGRTLADVGRKLLKRRLLESQEIHAEDGALSKFRGDDGHGKSTYEDLIKKAFDKRFWSDDGAAVRPDGYPKDKAGNPYSQMEANFSLFFGLATQQYMATLVSDRTPFDSPRTQKLKITTKDPQTGKSYTDIFRVPSAFKREQLRGMQVFINAHCNQCHTGPTLSLSVHPDLRKKQRNHDGTTTTIPKQVDRTKTATSRARLADMGFVSTGVTPASFDSGLGGKDPFDVPFSFSAQYQAQLLGKPELVMDKLSVQACLFSQPFYKEIFSDGVWQIDESYVNGFDDLAALQTDPAGTKGCVKSRGHFVSPPQIPTQAAAQAEASGLVAVGVEGTFKVPSLRNIELTGPYMHNGSLLTLDQVIDFYVRGGNYEVGDNPNKTGAMPSLKDILAEPLTQYGDKPNDEEAAIVQRNRQALIAFLKSLTDERVRFAKAPFDHPSMMIPAGHVGNESAVDKDAVSNLARDEYLVLPAVGRKGKAEALLPFDQEMVKATGTSDLDQDGASAAQGDCNDGDPAIHPGAEEVAFDGIDSNCTLGDSDVSTVTDNYQPDGVPNRDNSNPSVPFLGRDFTGGVQNVLIANVLKFSYYDHTTGASYKDSKSPATGNFVWRAWTHNSKWSHFNGQAGQTVTLTIEDSNGTLAHPGFTVFYRPEGSVLGWPGDTEGGDPLPSDEDAVPSHNYPQQANWVIQGLPNNPKHNPATSYELPFIAAGWDSDKFGADNDLLMHPTALNDIAVSDGVAGKLVKSFKLPKTGYYLMVIGNVAEAADISDPDGDGVPAITDVVGVAAKTVAVSLSFSNP